MVSAAVFQALEPALANRGGAARWKTLIESGFSASSLYRAVQCGAVSRPTRGVLALHGTPSDAIAVAALGGRLTCVSLLHRLKVPLREVPAGVHVGLGVNQHRTATSAALRETLMHRSGLISQGRQSPGVNGVPATTTATALDIASGCLDPLDHLIATDGALRMGLVTRADLSFARRGARARGMWLTRYADASAESLLETVSRWALTDAGFRVDSQVVIPGVGRVDLLVEDSVVVELDGREHHGTREAFARDRRRDRSLLAWGLKVLRFTYLDVLPVGARVVEDVSDALAAVPQGSRLALRRGANTSDRLER